VTEQLHLLLSKYRPDFADWLSANPHIWSAFCAKANEVWARGRRHYSARTIVEVMRHESAIAEASGEWKITNNFIPDMSRLFRDTFPERADLFETRLPHNARRAA
jgi:hypothetical protein